MGAWSYQILCDDSVCDAMYDIMDSEELAQTLEEFMQEALDAKDDYIDYDMGAYALAACATIDAVVNGPAWNNLLEEGSDTSDTEWGEFFEERAEEKASIEPLKGKAAEVLACILGENSELCELWSENDELFDSWKKNIEEVQKRLK